MAGLLAAGLVPARAQLDDKWPERPVTLVHGLSSTATTDIVARIVADSLERRLGQSVTVNARPGAGGRIAASQVARAAPDGYMLMTVPASFAVAAAIYKSLPYRPVDDFTMISMLTECPLLLVVSADSDMQSIGDLLHLGRSRSTPLLFGSVGNGSLQHLGGELLSRTVNITFRHVPYRSSVQATNDLIARRIDFMVDVPALQMPFIRAEAVRPLLVTSKGRFFAMPKVPTAVELDVPGFTFTAWHGIAGPAGLPTALVDRISIEIQAVLSEPDVTERLRRIGNDPTPSRPNEFRARVVSDIGRWLDVVENSRLERI